MNPYFATVWANDLWRTQFWLMCFLLLPLKIFGCVRKVESNGATLMLSLKSWLIRLGRKWLEKQLFLSGMASMWKEDRLHIF